MTTTAARAADLRRYTRVVVVTGAGVSAASGLPTYRQAGSGWADPDLEAKSHAARYGSHLPELWAFWGALRELAAAAQPNAAHRALAAASARTRAAGGSFTVLTQNVDGLHTRAGTPDVLELHGSIARSRCLRRSCGPPFLDASVPAPGAVPVCVRCGRATRPDVVLFGEKLAGRVMAAARARLRSADLCVYVGTSGQVWPAADLVALASGAGARCVLVNQEPWQEPHPAFTDAFIGRAEELLPLLLG